MVTTDMAIRDHMPAELVEKVVIEGDLSKLTAAEKLTYYRAICDSLQLNSLTRPFQYIYLQNKLTLYATRACAEQLARNHKISITLPEKAVVGDLYVVTARATQPDGRVMENVGIVNIKDLKGDALANAMLKAITKAMRRVTLSMCGMGFLDETEVETIPGARPVAVNVMTGEVMDVEPSAKPAPPKPAPAVISEEESVERGELLRQIKGDAAAMLISDEQLHKDAKKKAGVVEYWDGSTEYLRGLANRMALALKSKQADDARAAEGEYTEQA